METVYIEAEDECHNLLRWYRFEIQLPSSGVVLTKTTCTSAICEIVRGPSLSDLEATARDI